MSQVALAREMPVDASADQHFDRFFELARLKQQEGMSDSDARQHLRDRGFETGHLIDPRVDTLDGGRSRSGFCR